MIPSQLGHRQDSPSLQGADNPRDSAPRDARSATKLPGEGSPSIEHRLSRTTPDIAKVVLNLSLIAPAWTTVNQLRIPRALTQRAKLSVSATNAATSRPATASAGSARTPASFNSTTQRVSSKVMLSLNARLENNAVFESGMDEARPVLSNATLALGTSSTPAPTQHTGTQPNHRKTFLHTVNLRTVLDDLPNLRKAALQAAKREATKQLPSSSTTHPGSTATEEPKSAPPPTASSTYGSRPKSAVPQVQRPMSAARIPSSLPSGFTQTVTLGSVAAPRTVPPFSSFHSSTFARTAPFHNQQSIPRGAPQSQPCNPNPNQALATSHPLSTTLAELPSFDQSTGMKPTVMRMQLQLVACNQLLERFVAQCEAELPSYQSELLFFEAKMEEILEATKPPPVGNSNTTDPAAQVNPPHMFRVFALAYLARRLADRYSGTHPNLVRGLFELLHGLVFSPPRSAIVRNVRRILANAHLALANQYRGKTKAKQRTAHDLTSDWIEAGGDAGEHFSDDEDMDEEDEEAGGWDGQNTANNIQIINKARQFNISGSSRLAAAASTIPIPYFLLYQFVSESLKSQTTDLKQPKMLIQTIIERELHAVRKTRLQAAFRLWRAYAQKISRLNRLFIARTNEGNQRTTASPLVAFHLWRRSAERSRLKREFRSALDMLFQEGLIAARSLARQRGLNMQTERPLHELHREFEYLRQLSLERFEPKDAFTNEFFVALLGRLWTRLKQIEMTQAVDLRPLASQSVFDPATDPAEVVDRLMTELIAISMQPHADSTGQKEGKESALNQLRVKLLTTLERRYRDEEAQDRAVAAELLRKCNVETLLIRWFNANLVVTPIATGTTADSDNALTGARGDSTKPGAALDTSHRFLIQNLPDDVTSLAPYLALLDSRCPQLVPNCRAVAASVLSLSNDRGANASTPTSAAQLTRAQLDAAHTILTGLQAIGFHHPFTSASDMLVPPKQVATSILEDNRLIDADFRPPISGQNQGAGQRPVSSTEALDTAEAAADFNSEVRYVENGVLRTIKPTLPSASVTGLNAARTDSAQNDLVSPAATQRRITGQPALGFTTDHQTNNSKHTNSEWVNEHDTNPNSVLAGQSLQPGNESWMCARLKHLAFVSNLFLQFPAVPGLSSVSSLSPDGGADSSSSSGPSPTFASLQGTGPWFSDVASRDVLKPLLQTLEARVPVARAAASRQVDTAVFGSATEDVGLDSTLTKGRLSWLIEAYQILASIEADWVNVVMLPRMDQSIRAQIDLEGVNPHALKDNRLSLLVDELAIAKEYGATLIASHSAPDEATKKALLLRAELLSLRAAMAGCNRLRNLPTDLERLSAASAAANGSDRYNETLNEDDYYDSEEEEEPEESDTDTADLPSNAQEAREAKRVRRLVRRAQRRLGRQVVQSTTDAGRYAQRFLNALLNESSASPFTTDPGICRSMLLKLRCFQLQLDLVYHRLRRRAALYRAVRARVLRFAQGALQALWKLRSSSQMLSTGNALIHSFAMSDNMAGAGYDDQDEAVAAAVAASAAAAAQSSSLTGARDLNVQQENALRIPLTEAEGWPLYSEFPVSRVHDLLAETQKPEAEFKLLIAVLGRFRQSLISVFKHYASMASSGQSHAILAMNSSAVANRLKKHRGKLVAGGQDQRVGDLEAADGDEQNAAGANDDEDENAVDGADDNDGVDGQADERDGANGASSRRKVPGTALPFKCFIAFCTDCRLIDRNEFLFLDSQLRYLTKPPTVVGTGSPDQSQKKGSDEQRRRSNEDNLFAASQRQLSIGVGDVESLPPDTALSLDPLAIPIPPLAFIELFELVHIDPKVLNRKEQAMASSSLLASLAGDSSSASIRGKVIDPEYLPHHRITLRAWLEALIRIAHRRFPAVAGLAHRVYRLLLSEILPFARRTVLTSVRATLRHPRSAPILERYAHLLKALFQRYAQIGAPELPKIGQQTPFPVTADTVPSLSLSGFITMLRDLGELGPPHLTEHFVASVFAKLLPIATGDELANVANSGVAAAAAAAAMRIRQQQQGQPLQSPSNALSASGRLPMSKGSETPGGNLETDGVSSTARLDFTRFCEAIAAIALVRIPDPYLSLDRKLSAYLSTSFGPAAMTLLRKLGE